jgi:hypothetical protein
MKFRIVSILILLFTLSLASTTVSARKGVGIVWDTETEIVIENTEHCVQYGIYNPWEEDVTAALSVSADLQKIITKQESQAKLVQAATDHDVAVPIEFCFTVDNVYEEDCLVGKFICEQTCQAEQVVYEGKIVAMEASTGTSAEGAGSATTLGVSVPLKLKVKCSEHPREWTLVYVVVIIIVVILMLLIIYKKQKNK